MNRDSQATLRVPFDNGDVKEKSTIIQSAALEPPPPSPAINDSHANDSERLDGGIRAWLTVLGGFIALFCSFGQLNAFGTFQAWYSAHQLSHLQPSTISWIGSLQLWIFFFSGAFVGHAFDMHGPRPIIALGSLILVFSIMMTSLSTQYYQYMLGQGVLLGLGVGMLFYASLASIATHFKKYRATAIGIASAGSGVGGTVFPIILPRLFDAVGFAWAVRIVGFITLAGCALSLLFTTRHEPDVRCSREPSSWIDLPALRDARFMLLAAGSALVCFGLFIPYFYIASFTDILSADASSDPKNQSHSQAPSVSTPLAILNAASVLGRILPPLLADLIGPYNMLFPSAFLSGLFCLVLWLPSQQGAGFQPIIIAFAVLYGFASGAVIAVVPSCVAKISDVSLIGARMGMLYTLISIPSLLGNPAAGALLAHANGSYTDAIVLTACTILAGSLFILSSRLAVNKRMWERV
ncbi:hypothetical protein EW146_g1679 [Bondarzewia mesenterica]|uniref:Major facilitator superfamily (MFS) profile domain-containing protein n=1 Tax=Bondarzewia mesenterica TaxID=1095465 RepID=A0A4S4M995_9AGAM|nr:hypothetical protein EW146_g1679 [Bondarzewia mesenterica]